MPAEGSAGTLEHPHINCDIDIIAAQKSVAYFASVFIVFLLA